MKSSIAYLLIMSAFACSGGDDSAASVTAPSCTTDAAPLGGNTGQEHHLCAFNCGVASCYVPIDMSCNSTGFVIDAETPASGGGCTILYHCR